MAEPQSPRVPDRLVSGNAGPAPSNGTANGRRAATAEAFSPLAKPVLLVDQISAGYGKTPVLRDVSFQVRPGEVVAVLGSNGVGKTTTLRTIGGLVQPSSGVLSLNGTPITRWPPHRRAQAGICLIPEGRGIFRSLTVNENLRLQAGERRKSAVRFDAAFEAFPDLAARRNEIAGRLSGGQQQMLALARAYLTAPKVILLDELSMGLAPRIIDQIFAALQQLARTGVAMVLVEQYVTRAMRMAHTVVLLRKGSVSYNGPSAELDPERIVRGYLGVEMQDSAER
jgi:branched-chain amino acid transport system ATP-binding protein